MGRRTLGFREEEEASQYQVDTINHTREGIGHCRQPVGQFEGEELEGRWRRKGEKHWGAGDDPQHHHPTKTRAVRCEKCGMGSFIISVGRRGSSSTGRRPRGGSDMQTRNGNLIIADLVGSTRHARHLGTTTGNAGPRKQLGDNEDKEWCSRMCRPGLKNQTCKALGEMWDRGCSLRDPGGGGREQRHVSHPDCPW
jgi:hypothetical protein